jgi:hypothetical protein
MWIPVYTGMTEKGKEMTEKGKGMTEELSFPT